MDEGTKARVDLTVPPSMPEAERQRAAAGAPPRNAFDLVEKTQSGQSVALTPYFALRDDATQPIIDAINEASGGPGPDRFLSPEIDAVVELVQSRRILAIAENTTGPLQ
jgi:hypothetical protein